LPSRRFGLLSFSYDAAKSIAVILFTGLSYLVLFRISLPFDNYRAIVFIFCLLAGVAFFFMDIYFTDLAPNQMLQHLFGIEYKNLTSESIALGAGLFVFLSGLYFLLDWASRSIVKKSLNRAEEEKKA
jgi:glucan phosphoethanolaminetransferase (alkaline phosphatase superfamily)